MNIKPPTIAVATLAFIALAAAIACGTEEPSSAPAQVAPSPSPTSHAIVPISFEGVEDVDSFLAVLPEAEGACLANSSLGFLLTAEAPAEALFESEPFSQLFGRDWLLAGTPTPDEFAGFAGDVMALAAEAVECVSDETIKGALVGSIVTATGVELSESTLQCMGERWSDFDFQQMLLEILDSYDATLFAAVYDMQSQMSDEQAEFPPLTTEMAGLIAYAIDKTYSAASAAFCINEDEREAMGEAGDALDIVECGFNAFDRGEATQLVLDVYARAGETSALAPEEIESFDSLADLPPEFIAALGTFLADCSEVLAETGMFDSNSGDNLDDLFSQLEQLGAPGGGEIPPELQGLLEDLQAE